MASRAYDGTLDCMRYVDVADARGNLAQAARKRTDGRTHARTHRLSRARKRSRTLRTRCEVIRRGPKSGEATLKESNTMFLVPISQAWEARATQYLPCL